MIHLRLIIISSFFLVFAFQHAKALPATSCQSLLSSIYEEHFRWPVNLLQFQRILDPMRKQKSVVQELDQQTLINSINRIKKTLIQHNPDRYLTIKTIFYPLGGNDILYPLILFENAKTIILMDENPFLNFPDYEKLKQSRRFPVLNSYFTRYRHIGEIQLDGSMGARILGYLLHLYPELKLHTIHTYYSNGLNNKKSNQLSGMIEYSVPGETQQRRIIFIQHFLKTYDFKENLQGHWVRSLFESQPIDAIVIKAAMSLFMQPNPNTLEIMKRLRQSGGYLIYGQGEFLNQYPFPLFKTNSLPPLIDTPLGYGNETDILEFKKIQSNEINNVNQEYEALEKLFELEQKNISRDLNQKIQLIQPIVKKIKKYFLKNYATPKLNEIFSFIEKNTAHLDEEKITENRKGYVFSQPFYKLLYLIEFYCKKIPGDPAPVEIIFDILTQDTQSEIDPHYFISEALPILHTQTPDVYEKFISGIHQYLLNHSIFDLFPSSISLENFLSDYRFLIWRQERPQDLAFLIMTHISSLDKGEPYPYTKTFLKKALFFSKKNDFPELTARIEKILNPSF